VAIAWAETKLLHERVSPWQRAGMALALCGVLFVVAKGDLGNLRDVRFTVGDGWILAAALSWVAYTVLLQRWPCVLGPMPRLAAIAFGGLLVLLPFTALEAFISPWPALSAKALWLIVPAGLLPGFFWYQAYAYMLRELGAARSSLVMYLSPVCAAFTAWAVLGEAPRAYHAVGAALILPAIWLATRKPAGHG
jgi:drug/metabolite transporter (DMT)-like permease